MSRITRYVTEAPTTAAAFPTIPDALNMPQQTVLISAQYSGTQHISPQSALRKYSEQYNSDCREMVLIDGWLQRRGSGAPHCHANAATPKPTPISASKPPAGCHGPTTIIPVVMQTAS
ncbi:hypothetical protein LSTR_LSTR015848 [Laodelphax striatellus]|uniref:Uncharacterized protein n=1 Tax=Laodelphax striatellus TaxID=195883 RepID=A0A482XBQ5_LAOST|nr:hypothetical protein LSTR_LSTR015848 [Laodelphax striatellus]